MSPPGVLKVQGLHGAGVGCCGMYRVLSFLTSFFRFSETLQNTSRDGVKAVKVSVAIAHGRQRQACNTQSCVLGASLSLSITPVKLRQETTKSTECHRWTSNLQIRLRKSATAPERGAQSLFVTTTLGYVLVDYPV